RKPGLWLSWYYQKDDDVQKLIIDARKKALAGNLAPVLRGLPVDARDGIFNRAEYMKGMLTPDFNPERKTRDKPSGHVGTAVGIATFLTQLYTGRLVDPAATKDMLKYLGHSPWLTARFRGVGTGAFYNKVGYTPPKYCDSVIVESRSLQLAFTANAKGS